MVVQNFNFHFFIQFSLFELFENKKIYYTDQNLDRLSTAYYYFESD